MIVLDTNVLPETTKALRESVPFRGFGPATG
jgi:hypothetical protein